MVRYFLQEQVDREAYDTFSRLKRDYGFGNKKTMITHDTPTSTNIARIQYDPATAVMKVEFRSGRTYSYADVPMDIWNAFISAPSAGKFFNSTIKGVYKESAV